MPIDYEHWCKHNTNLTPLVRALKSSIPEQYIGFYLHKMFGDEIEYQKQFDWLGKRSLDVYIPSLKLAIEYDGIYYHSKKAVDDDYKSAICRSYGIHLIHIQEKKQPTAKSKKQNEITYYYSKDYKNIDVALQDLCTLINKRYGTSIDVNVDLARDKNNFLAYIQSKFYKKTIAYVWPEVKDYWLEEENGASIFDVFHTDSRCFVLQCPHCGKQFRLFTRYVQNRKSLVPCDCEYKKIEKSFEEAIEKYRETGEVVVIDDSLQSRRLYDRMESVVNKMWHCQSKEEAELYKKLGFKSPYIDVYLSLE